MKPTRLATTELEARLTPSFGEALTVSQDQGVVRLVNVATQRTTIETTPFPGFDGGIETAIGDINNDTYDDLIVAAGQGGGPHVKVYSGKDSTLLQSFFAYEPEFTGGVYLGCADVNGDGRADIITGAGDGGGPRVRVMSGATGATLRDFFAYDSTFRGGATVTATDCDLDGFAEIITGAGPGGGPHVRMFAGRTNTEQGSFFAFDSSFKGGIFVACAEVNNDGHPDILVTPNSGGGPVVHRYDGVTRNLIDSTLIGNPDDRNGARLPSDPVPKEDAVHIWNQVALQAIKETGMPPPKASRLLAMVHIALFDAVNSIVGGYEPYLTNLPVPAAGSLPDVAASSAAYQILRDQLPSVRNRFDQVWAEVTADDISKSGYSEGKAQGEVIAARLLESRANDGATTAVAYTPGTEPGQWRPTPPANAAALLPNWGHVTPFALSHGDQFRAASPPQLTSAEYATAYDEVMTLGSKASTARTADQTEIALFWADGAGTVTPPGHWNLIAQHLASQKRLNLLETARLLAALNTALADAGISAWDTKYADNLWRPITAIRQGDTDGNAATIADANWEPLLTTPPFPSYTSGHSTFSGAAAEVLRLLLGDNTFDTSTDAIPDVTRRFDTFREAAEEAGKSRIYGGIHYEFDNSAGLTAGQQIGGWVLANDFKPVLPQ